MSTAGADSTNSTGQRRPEQRAASIRERLVQILHGRGQATELLTDLSVENEHLRARLEEVQGIQEQLRGKIKALVAPPHYPGVVVAVESNGELTAEVVAGGIRAQVAVDPEVPEGDLRIGTRVLLSAERNCILKVLGPNLDWHEVGTFEGYFDRDRVVLRYQEQLTIVPQAEELLNQELRQGEFVGFSHEGAVLAYERVELPPKENLFMEKTPEDRFEELGGLEREIQLLKKIISRRLTNSELAEIYQLPEKCGILLTGPAGNGKTKLARCLANYLAALSPTGNCRFMAIDGSSDYSMWLGGTEQKIISRFLTARDIATREGIPVVIFFDEVDAIARRRGTDYGSGAPDRILGTLLSQLDGIRRIRNIVVLAACNRPDILDDAFIRSGRLGDEIIHIPAPNRRSARAILQCYLKNGAPVHGDADVLIEVLLSRLFNQRGPYAELADVSLRDGRRVAVRGTDLLSGAALENVVKRAAQDAFDREVAGGERGITEGDLVSALDRQLHGVLRVLTRVNIRNYLGNLPVDVEVLEVVPKWKPVGLK